MTITFDALKQQLRKQQITNPDRVVGKTIARLCVYFEQGITFTDGTFILFTRGRDGDMEVDTDPVDSMSTIRNLGLVSDSDAKEIEDGLAAEQEARQKKARREQYERLGREFANES